MELYPKHQPNSPLVFTIDAYCSSDDKIKLKSWFGTRLLISVNEDATLGQRLRLLAPCRISKYVIRIKANFVALINIKPVFDAANKIPETCPSQVSFSSFLNIIDITGPF